MLQTNSGIFFSIALAIFCNVESVKLPDAIGRCVATDPNLDNCLRKNVEGAIRYFKNGAPQLGIPPFEPLKITKLIIGQGDGPVNVQQNFENVELFGLTGSIISKYGANLDSNLLYVESTSPNLRLTGDYEVSGRLLVLPIRGQGKFNITLVNAELTHNLTMERYTKKDKTYWRMLDYQVTIVPKRMYYNLDNLFDGDERLGREINNVLNDNWDSIYNDVKSSYEKSFGIIFKGLADSLFSRVPLDEVFILNEA